MAKTFKGRLSNEFGDFIIIRNAVKVAEPSFSRIEAAHGSSIIIIDGETTDIEESYDGQNISDYRVVVELPEISKTHYWTDLSRFIPFIRQVLMAKTEKDTLKIGVTYGTKNFLGLACLLFDLGSHSCYFATNDEIPSSPLTADFFEGDDIGDYIGEDTMSVWCTSTDERLIMMINNRDKDVYLIQRPKMSQTSINILSNVLRGDLSSKGVMNVETLWSATSSALSMQREDYSLSKKGEKEGATLATVHGLSYASTESDDCFTSNTSNSTRFLQSRKTKKFLVELQNGQYRNVIVPNFTVADIDPIHWAAENGIELSQLYYKGKIFNPEISLPMFNLHCRADRLKRLIAMPYRNKVKVIDFSITYKPSNLILKFDGFGLKVLLATPSNFDRDSNGCVQHHYIVGSDKDIDAALIEAYKSRKAAKKFF